MYVMGKNLRELGSLRWRPLCERTPLQLAGGQTTAQFDHVLMYESKTTQLTLASRDGDSIGSPLCHRTTHERRQIPDKSLDVGS